MVLLWRAAPHLHFRARPQIPRLRGDRDQIGAPLYFWCSGAPFSAESVPLGPGGRGLGVCTQAEIQNSI